MSLIEVRSLNQTFGQGENRVEALKNINIDIHPHRLTILKGRSGSGKTCMINLLGALDRPTEGQIFYKGKDILKMSENARDELRRREYGFIFQSVALIPVMTAYENIDFALRLSGYDGDRDARVKECLTMVGLEKRMHHRPAEMSGGEQQRVAIARAISHRPGIILADEPTAELDSHMGLVVIKLLRELVAQEKITIVMTTHDPNMFELADDVYNLENGVVTENIHVTPLEGGALA